MSSCFIGFLFQVLLLLIIIDFACTGKFDQDTICAPKTRCTASSERAMYDRYPANDSTSFYKNGSDVVCAYYSKCGDGNYQSFPGDEKKIMVIELTR